MRTIGNYTVQENRDFPLDAEGLLAIQDNIAMCEIIGNIAGDKVILAGCEVANDGKHLPGYMFLHTDRAPRGEVLYFEGGAGDSLYIKNTAIAISAEQREYTEAYTDRCLASGIASGATTYKWADFTYISTNKLLHGQIAEMTTALATIKPVPAGVIEVYAGIIPPVGYLMCDGQSLAIVDYDELYKAIGDKFSSAPSPSGAIAPPPAGYFRVPDLRSRFVVGYNGDDTEYNALGKAGGAKTVALSEAQIPAHDHTTNSQFNKLAAKSTDIGGKSSVSNPDVDASGVEYSTTVKVVSSWGDATIKSIGGGESHENRPPYYALSYIIKTGK
ncbi:MAG: tail fiber protein [Muribaculaceae bacterium]